MENGTAERWGFRGNEVLSTASAITIRGVLNEVMGNINESDPRPVIPLGHGDPSAFPCFRTTQIADDAVADALRSAKFNGAIADYLSKDLPYKLSPGDIYLTIGCTQAIEVILTALARPKANILLPRPGFPFYEARAAYSRLEVRHFDLLPEKGWEVDLDAVVSLADENTVGMVVINPGNPCGNVFPYQHLKKIAETAKKLGILVIADEVYDHLTFGSNPFVPMGVFGSIVPVVTVGSISKRLLIASRVFSIFPLTRQPLFRRAVPRILEKTGEVFFSKIVNILREAADVCYDTIKEIPCITCPNKPEGSMFVMVKLNLSLLEDIKDDIDFCVKLAKEESVVVLPGVAVGLKNWLRVTFAIEPSSLEEVLLLMSFLVLAYINPYRGDPQPWADPDCADVALYFLPCMHELPPQPVVVSLESSTQ
ncbi:hypothetical protein RHMOL_Rhmol06G0197400 [Rhododendron molle]|uniref:Uncharacterized protein n=1 Tax=Rhododendron molle TaxID=49168 RepID=A0ACC0NE04_RHOML|nr:hypothetical protein RHMOL_Rhmol06G0197400 [Rhododendron molle]